MKIDRMLTIIVMLLNRERISAKELAGKFEISVRTVYRDIDAINMAGIPIISYPGNNGGFGIMENYKLDHQLLTLNNLSAMLSALNSINSTLEDIELESSIEKLRNLIPKNKTEHVNLHMEQIIINMLPWNESSTQKERVKMIQHSIAQSRLIAITYRNYAGETRSRRVEPMTLIFKGYTWYLFAYCHLKRDFRIFRISRISELQIEEKGFTRREKSYHDLEKAARKPAALTRMTLKFSPQVRTRVEDFFDRENIEILETGDLLVTVDSPEEEWTFSMILSFGEHVEVLAPDRVRRTVASRVQSMLAKYHAHE